MLFRKLFSFLATVAIFILLFVAYFHPITAITQDLGRHILTGKIIWTTHHVPKTNLFSYTYPTFPFINHHWLSEVIFYLLYTLAGFNGLLIITTLIMLIAFGLIFIYSFKQKSTNIIALLTSSILYLTILFERADVRPEIFSFLFLSLFLIILFKNRENPTRLIFLLIPIELVWANMHIYFFAGIIALVLFFLDAIIRTKGSFLSKEVQTIGLTTILAGLITIINPNGLNGTLYPFHVLQNYGYAIEENQTIFLLQQITTNPIIYYFEATVMCLFILLFLRIKKTQPIDWFLAITFSIIGTMAIRNFPLFVFATFIPFVRLLSPMITTITGYLAKNIKRPVSWLHNSLLCLLLLIIMWQIITTMQNKHTGFGVITGAKNAADFYHSKHIKGPVFNNFDIGSYLEYRIFPEQKVFVDGRPEAYPAKFFEQIYRPMQKDPRIFSTVDQMYHVNSIFFAHTDQTPWASQFIKDIMHNAQWKTVYLDDTIVILLKVNEHNMPIINRFAIDESHASIIHLQPENIDSLFQLAHFFSEAGWSEQELSMYQYIFQVNPNQCNALYNATLLLQQQNSPLASMYSSRYLTYCK